MAHTYVPAENWIRKMPKKLFARYITIKIFLLDARGVHDNQPQASYGGLIGVR
jgi:hypothetical protein